MKHARADYDRIQDPIGKIPADEPVFLLRGQDKYAAQAVEYYARLVRLGGGDRKIATLADAHAERMRQWPVHKFPDLPKEEELS
jgi:hypothetical protein